MTTPAKPAPSAMTLTPEERAARLVYVNRSFGGVRVVGPGGYVVVHVPGEDGTATCAAAIREAITTAIEAHTQEMREEIDALRGQIAEVIAGVRAHHKAPDDLTLALSGAKHNDSGHHGVFFTADAIRALGRLRAALAGKEKPHG